MPTEDVNQRFVDIDSWSTENAVAAMLDGQLGAVAAISSQASFVAEAADAAAERLLRGGRLVYVGAGTSGRIAVQDGVELTPTYGWDEQRLVFLIAGGFESLWKSSEDAEDHGEDAVESLRKADIGPNDVVVGVAASGRTPYTVSAIKAARDVGALTIGVANNAGTPLLNESEHPLCADTGSELVAGSTRMKAGTAQKAILNLLSTATMIRCGRVYKGLMVNMIVSNEKLLNRAVGMVSRLAEVDMAEAEAALAEAGKDIKLAILIAQGFAKDAARRLLEDNQGNLRQAIARSQ